MSPDVRRRLVGCLGLLSSDADGERAAAGLLATRLLKSAGLSWDEVIVEKAVVVHRSASSSPNWRDTCRRLLERPRELSPWEFRFISGLPKFPRLSQKQRHFLREIAERVLGESA